MPIFEFLCTSCGNVFEKLVYETSDVATCNKCGNAELTKLLSSFSSLSGARQKGKLPGTGDNGCCGSAPTSQGCIPGSCCGKA
jgi:putative FmdB family regulatory protein